MSVVRGAFILLLLALLSFAFGFFVVARVMPGEKPAQTPENNAPTVSPGGNERGATRSDAASRPSASAENNTNPASSQPGPTIDPEEKPEVQQPDTLDSTHNPPSQNDQGENGSGTNTALETQEPERDPFAAVTPDSHNAGNTGERTRRRGERDAVQSPASPDHTQTANAGHSEPTRREGSQANTTTEPTNGSGLFRVQSGVYSTREAAEREAGRLNEQGLSASVHAMTSGGRTLYRVQHGAYRSRANAESAQARLKSAGIESTISQTD